MTPTDDVLEDLRLAIYRGFSATGALPPITELAAISGGADALVAGLAELAERRHVVLDDAGELAMAHPFATRSFGFSVMSATTLWWGGCAWDSFAIPNLVPSAGDVLVATRCPTCDTALAWVVGRNGPPVGTAVAHFLVPVARMWNDVIHTCTHQRLFCADACIDRWLAASGETEGDRLAIDTLWHLAAHWYDGRLERGYQRRQPTEAKDYLRSVGLRGAFWGLDG